MLLEETGEHDNREIAPQNPKAQSLLLAFKPRQVLLAQKTNTTAKTTMKNHKTTLNPHQKSLLLSSVLCYLHSNGYSKPLKRLISSAHVQDDSWKACLLNLEDMFKHYLDTCSSVDAKLDTSKAKELLTNGTKKDEDDLSSEEAVVKKKQKKGEDSDNAAVVAEDVELKTKKKTKKTSESVEESRQVTEQATKEQKDKKKKSKHNSDPLESNVDSKEEVKSKDKRKKSDSSAKSDGDGEADTDAEGKSKDKNKKSKHNSELFESNVSKEEVKSTDKKKKSESSAKSVGDVEADPVAEGKSKDKKKKKKKQNSDSGEKEMDNALEAETIFSKDKKEKEDPASETLSNGVSEVANKEGVVKEEKESKKRKRSDSDDIDKGTPLTNGNHEVKRGESTGHKSRRMDNNGSAEPKTVTAFQRVKIVDVEFADERLQDNSYWAKDGADVGYGAKAQEVLGQVRGRDFRHEKTKKKRGSYRGGQIDLHSHSVKFNYNDEE